QAALLRAGSRHAAEVFAVGRRRRDAARAVAAGIARLRVAVASHRPAPAALLRRHEALHAQRLGVQPQLPVHRRLRSGWTVVRALTHARQNGTHAKSSETVLRQPPQGTISSADQPGESRLFGSRPSPCTLSIALLRTTTWHSCWNATRPRAALRRRWSRRITWKRDGTRSLGGARFWTAELRHIR